VLDNGEPQPGISRATGTRPARRAAALRNQPQHGTGNLPIAAAAQKALAELRPGDRVAAMAFNTTLRRSRGVGAERYIALKK